MSLERRVRKLEGIEGKDLKILSVEEINDNLYRKQTGWYDETITEYTRAEIDEYQRKGYQIIIMSWVSVGDIKNKM